MRKSIESASWFKNQLNQTLSNNISALQDHFSEEQELLNNGLLSKQFTTQNSFSSNVANRASSVRSKDISQLNFANNSQQSKTPTKSINTQEPTNKLTKLSTKKEACALSQLPNVKIESAVNSIDPIM